jgi:NAD(P)-dependent dehydrogenase (short-subunit alcohol dehydrogenase family)
MTETHPIAIVTGASRGIGRAIAIALANHGYHVVVNYARNEAAAQEVGQLIAKAGRRPLLVQADVGRPQDRLRLVEETIKTFGRIDLLVNNAGIAPQTRADLLDATEEAFDRLLAVNLKGPHFLTQLVARQMIGESLSTPHTSPSDIPGDSNGGGQPVTNNPQPTTPPRMIITITSVSAYAASVNRSDYCIAKAGLSMMTQLYAARLAQHGINVYEIRPGVIETDMTGPVKEKYQRLIDQDLTPIKRWGQPEDVAKAVIALVQGHFPFSTGEVINVDGGYHMRRL